MKKLVLTVLAMALAPTLVIAQGTTSFGSSTGQQYIQYDNLDKVAGAACELWWSPDNVVAYTSIASATTGTGPAAGFIAPAVVATTGPATAGGSVAWFQISASDGTYTGYSPMFQNPTGNPNGTPPTAPTTLTGWLNPITIPVPEPGTLVLAGLGVASLLIFRRRK